MVGILELSYRDETAGIHYHIGRVGGIYAMDDIHRVRVGIKKIKAVHRLLGSSFSEIYDSKSLNKRYKRIFKTFGRYRELINTILLLKKFRVPGKFRIAYAAAQNELIKRLRSDIDYAIEMFDAEKDISDYEEVVSRLNNIDRAEEISLMHSFIGKEREKASSILDNNPDDEELHRIRIILKNIKPILKLLYPLEDSAFRLGNYRLLNRTESLIGDWHDRHILRESLESFMQHNTNISIQVSSRRLISRIVKKEELRLPRILKLTNKCLLSLERITDKY